METVCKVDDAKAGLCTVTVMGRTVKKKQVTEPSVSGTVLQLGLSINFFLMRHNFNKDDATPTPLGPHAHKEKERVSCVEFVQILH